MGEDAWSPRVSNVSKVAARRERASERQALREKRSAKQQLALLDQRLGKGVGAAKEREKLAELAKREKQERQRQAKKRAKEIEREIKEIKREGGV